MDFDDSVGGRLEGTPMELWRKPIAMIKQLYLENFLRSFLRGLVKLTVEVRKKILLQDAWPKLMEVQMDPPVINVAMEMNGNSWKLLCFT